MTTTSKREIELTFTDILVSTVPTNEDLFLEHVGKDHPEDIDHLPDPETIEQEIQRQSCVFFRAADGQTPALHHHHIKGFLKDAARMLRRIPPIEQPLVSDPERTKKVPATISGAMSSYLQKIDGLIFVEPDWLPLQLVNGAKAAWLDRPARVDTPRGPRTCLLHSESAPTGTIVHLAVRIYDPEYWPWIEEMLDYGANRGLGAWRNSGKGRFSWRYLDV